MNYQTIADVYAANDKIRENLKETVKDLTDEQANFVAEDGTWSVAQLVEHLALVEEGMTRISAKLLNEAKGNGKNSDGSVRLSEDFIKKAEGARTVKVEAPEKVRPKGDRTITESLAKMEENRKVLNELRPLFESVECSEHKFPHPAFGELTAHEWLMLIGGHEFRHLAQINRILE